MMILLFILFISQVHLLPIEVCEKAYIHHQFKNCPVDPPRRFGSADSICPNEGTWECSTFECHYPNPFTLDGYCKYGEVDYSQCCTHKELKFTDMWFVPNINSGIDWEWDIYNLDIKGNAGDILINGSNIFENVYNYSCYGGETYIAASLEYNDTCITKLKIYINGSLVINVEETLDIYFFSILRNMIEIDRESGNNEKVFFISSWEMIPTDEQVLYLYNLGKNRSTDIELCYDVTITELDTCQDQLNSTNSTLSTITGTLESCVLESKIRYSLKIAFMILFCIFFVLCIVLAGLLFYMYSKYKEIRYTKLFNR